MKNITNIIEEYLKQILMKSNTGFIEIQRSQLAEEFNCVPSQINYVITTRFTLEKGYMVESKRGGGGFIRIRKLSTEDKDQLLMETFSLVGEEISQVGAEGILERLLEEGFITRREMEMIKGMVSRNVLRLPTSVRDEIRARLMKTVIATLIRFKDGEEE
ncbi:Transcriptional regulator CtsR [[Clostridium] ultunense Esp]|uniref:CtsR family transcriptional regulator n=1 Tax=Thermicanus aegyptius TaxID=94009 RepID=UPI0002B704B9|nr:CtsR family transcriptional regulator [Thermicanus aegyptius]CCQ93790.1 Transcriptional regulator CtsR [[Clostridium] ultunense Esp]